MRYVDFQITLYPIQVTIMARPKNSTGSRQREKTFSSTAAVERAYEYILEQTIAFGFRPSERINEVELASTLDMSRAPVREALNRLVMGGFVVFESGKGFFCRKFSVSEISDLYGVRADLETAAVRKACAEASTEDIAAIQETWSDTARRQLEMDIDELVDADESFHLSLAMLAGNNERIRMLKNINARIRFVRKINIENERVRSRFVVEHSDILQSLASHDETRLLGQLDEHFGINSKMLKNNIHEGLARIYAEETR